MYILTECDLLLNQDIVSDSDQRLLLNELRRFLTHESAGVKGFDRMPKEWSDLNRLVSSGGVVSAKSTDALAVVSAWHQETRDLALILSRMTETGVTERLNRKHKRDGAARLKDDVTTLRERNLLWSELDVPDAAASLSIVVDLKRRGVDVGMTLRAPEDKVTTKARVNWMLRQIKTDRLEDLYLRLMWPGKAEPTQFLISEIKDAPHLAERDREHLSPHSFHLFRSKRLGARFAQQANFIADIEDIVPQFYRDIGSYLTAWQRRAPKIKDDRASADDVSTRAISEDAGDYSS